MPNPPDLRYPQPEPATVPPSPWLADAKPFKPYVYRGQGFDIYQEARCPRSTRPSAAGATGSVPCPRGCGPYTACAGCRRCSACGYEPGSDDDDDW